ncbi:hypothetical protein FB45DRAFT_871523 [Roridomyces roridus]|uniref:Uncharacterized protein n=1 Tax=Roridomyces roridus TaxID=1738132 RepID=A0AAD7BFC1_9AGAR|nr:hypothetical protein FB45DRAFT_871523 [Roridomyces roridus]
MLHDRRSQGNLKVEIVSTIGVSQGFKVQTLKVGSVAARMQTETGDPGIDTLVDLLVPFQMIYDDGVERLASESLLERQKEAVHRPPVAVSESDDADSSSRDGTSGPSGIWRFL